MINKILALLMISSFSQTVLSVEELPHLFPPQPCEGKEIPTAYFAHEGYEGLLEKIDSPIDPYHDVKIVKISDLFPKTNRDLHSVTDHVTENSPAEIQILLSIPDSHSQLSDDQIDEYMNHYFDFKQQFIGNVVVDKVCIVSPDSAHALGHWKEEKLKKIYWTDSPSSKCRPLNESGARDMFRFISMRYHKNFQEHWDAGYDELNEKTDFARFLHIKQACLQKRIFIRRATMLIENGKVIRQFMPIRNDKFVRAPYILDLLRKGIKR